MRVKLNMSLMRHFTRKFSNIPVQRSNSLETTNHHPLDSLMSFNADSHQYFYKSIAMKYSVTELIEKYFNKFDSNKAILGMQRGSNWPRPEYTKEDGSAFTTDEIIKQWETVGEESRQRGTLMHASIEDFVNFGQVESTQTPEFVQFQQFYKTHVIDAGITPFRTEWRIAAPDMRVGGSVDFVGRLPKRTTEDGVVAEDEYVIIDWKRSKNLVDKMHASYGRYGNKPLEKVPDCLGSKYGLQLNIYRYILERYYHIPIRRLVLTSFHPELETYFQTDIPLMERPVQAIVEDLYYED